MLVEMYDLPLKSTFDWRRVRQILSMITSLSFTPINVRDKNVCNFFVNTLEFLMVEFKKKKNIINLHSWFIIISKH